MLKGSASGDWWSLGDYTEVAGMGADTFAPVSYDVHDGSTAGLGLQKYDFGQFCEPRPSLSLLLSFPVSPFPQASMMHQISCAQLRLRVPHNFAALWPDHPQSILSRPS